MIKHILQIGDPILERPTSKVTNFKSAEIKALINDLLDTCIALEKRSAGLSANQIGVDASICICRRTDLEERKTKKQKRKKIPANELWEVMINPKIIEFGNDESMFWEGCLSIGVSEKETVYGPVWRTDKIKVEYQNREGELQKLDAEGFFSHVIQHEIDHLNGILFLSHVSNPLANLWKGEKLDKYIDKHGEYPEPVRD